MKALLPGVLVLLAAQTALAAAPPADLVPPKARQVKSSVEAVTEYDVAMTPYAVDAFYRKAFLKRGWKPGDSVSYGTTMVLYASKPPHGVGRVTITPRGNNATHVTLSLTD